MLCEGIFSSKTCRH